MRYRPVVIIVLLFFSWIYPGYNHAKSVVAPANQFAIHLDKPLYITGDIIWYQLYLPQALSNENVAIQGMLITPDDRVEERFFHRSDGQTNLNGRIKIPYSLPSGIYHLVFKGAQTGAGGEVILTEIEVPIYNDLQPLDNLSGLDSDNYSAASLPSNGLDVSIELAEQPIARRDQVNAVVNIKDGTGKGMKSDFSVSVIHYPFDDMVKYQPFAVGPELPESILASLNESIYLKGQLLDSLENPIQANVLGAYASKQNKIHYAKTDPEGKFTLELPDFYALQTLQFLGYYKEQPEIKVNLTPDNSHRSTSKPLIVNEAIQSYLELSRQRKKLAQYYESLTPESVAGEFIDEIQELDPDFTYNTREYIKFEDIGSFFTELITPLQLRKVKGKYQATMTNPTARITAQTRLKGSPLYIIDGKATRNTDFIANINLGNVETIELFYKPENLRRQFNVMGSSGVVRIKTINPIFEIPPNDQEDLFEVSGLQPVADFTPYVPVSSASQDHKLPNFRSTVYWSPEQTTAGNGTADIQFHHTDDKGIFLITVMVQDGNGQTGIATQTYVVK